MTKTNDLPILVAGEWRPAQAVATFHATNPRTRMQLPDAYPVSGWSDIDDALNAARSAASHIRALPDRADRMATFLEGYASRIESAANELVTAAAEETGLPAQPRLRDVELPRTTGQLRQAAVAAREQTWRRPTIDSRAGLRSCLAAIGPVWVLGPNNFPFAFNGISGGDFAAAIAAGNPVIAKAHPLHPKTTRLLAEAAHLAAQEAGLPAGTVQLFYHTTPEDGLRLAGDPRLAAIAFTGGRPVGLKLKAAADAAGTPFFAEMSSINPTVILPEAIGEDSDNIAAQLATSLLMGTGQFCTKPGLILLLAGPGSEQFIRNVGDKLAAAPSGVLFSEGGEKSLANAISALRAAGAECVVGNTARTEPGFGVVNTLLRAPAAQFLKNPGRFQTEMFGNAALVVVADNAGELISVLDHLEGNLTGTIYSAKGGADDVLYEQTASVLRSRVGRLLNDKMPTGVAVSAAQHHGGPFPAATQPHFTAVGMPGAILRFTRLEAFDNVRPHRLPICLRDQNPTGRMWRMIDGNWTQGDVTQP